MPLTGIILSLLQAHVPESTLDKIRMATNKAWV
jgi:hypothetical protein